MLQFFKNLFVKMPAAAGDGQCEVVLVGCGAPKRGMGWYHAEQLMKDKCPSAKLCFIVEPWFLGGGESTLEPSRVESCLQEQVFLLLYSIF